VAADLKVPANIGDPGVRRKVAGVSALPNTVKQRPTFANFFPA